MAENDQPEIPGPEYKGGPYPLTPRGINDLPGSDPGDEWDESRLPKPSDKDTSLDDLAKLESHWNNTFGPEAAATKNPEVNFQGNTDRPGGVKETSLAALTGGAASPIMIQGWTDLISLVEEVKDELIKANAALLAIANKEG